MDAWLLRYNTTDNHFSQYNGKYVSRNFNSTDGRATNDLSKAWIFTTKGSAKSCSYSGPCELVPIELIIKFKE